MSAELDDLVASIRKSYANRSPRAIARDERSRAARETREATPERERIIANMRHPHAYYKAIMDRQRAISMQDTLTEDDKDELAQTHIDLADCPYLQPPEVKASFVGTGPAHYQEWLQEMLWDYLWWADYFGQTLDEYLGRSSSLDLYGPIFRAALKNSTPMPEGYVVSTRRGN